MKKVLVLLAGYPATGKSFLCNKILEKYPEFQIVSQDTMKEELFDEYGLNNLEENVKLEQISWQKYYETIDCKMGKSEMIISDYPFSDKQKGTLDELSKKYDYRVLTIRLIGDIQTLYQRSTQRDNDASRHLGHMVSCYHKGDVLEDRTKCDCFVTFEIFKARCENKGYDKFQLGALIEIDVTDYSKIDYDQILSDISKFID